MDSCAFYIQFNWLLCSGKYYWNHFKISKYFKMTPFKWDLTMYFPMIVVGAFIFLIAGLFFLMTHVVINVPYTFLIYRLLIVACLIMVCWFRMHNISFNGNYVLSQFIMYHSQLIYGQRFAEIRPFDYWLGALILYSDFLILFLFSFQVAPKWSDACNTNETFVFILDHHVPKFKTSY